jgi:phenylalanyl-tRNA synthetase alpha chain
MLEKLKEITSSVESKLSQVTDKPGLEEVRIEFLGRKGLLPALTSEMKDVAPEDRPAAGKALNEAKQSINTLFAETEARLSAGDKGDSSAIDVTLPGRKTPLGTQTSHNQNH